MRKAIFRFITGSVAVLVFSSVSDAATTVFQAAGPNAQSIQGTVDQFRTALGGANNGNTPGPLAAGRREINWDGGGSSATSFATTPFDGFLNIRGGRFITDGSGFLQAPAAGLGDFVGNPFYPQIFKAFSPVRLFAPVGSNFTETRFFIPGTNGGVPATTRGFGVVFTDVDRADPLRRGRCNTCTLVEYLDVNGQVLFTGAAPASPADGNLSFLGVIFDDARVASVRITTGAVELGPIEFDFLDLVVMDDFIYAEPQALQQ